ncbi:RNase adapter RapZ [Novosphingobium sp. FSY-8]|uniref:RNase adapter RapZ n=1 Tax=Novosphingobium ovatum TaxID=1908523 RepID=A0ABW9XB07_9SPHN|nr:RNase adapter RapZ [Novosphingobium ovatum]NBC35687.1 RNase adapter RapZ [Novosphingobium ovatum]
MVAILTSDKAPASARQRVLLVTGVLGAGKTTALNVLEDLGWETIDNFPIRLLDRLIDSGEAPAGDGAIHAPLAIGFDSRTRGFNPHEVIQLVKRLTARADLELTTLYLDCATGELERRYNETRRRHPMASDLPVVAGINAEREMMEPLRRWADIVINSTMFSANQLQQAIREQFSPDSGPELTLTVSSFGFSRGMPPVADFVFDMRFLNNPHWDTVLRPMTGREAAVGDFIRQDPAFDTAYVQIRDLLLTVLPRFRAQGKAYVHVAFGCTGGRHRSVFMAEQISAALRASGFSLTILHRNLGSRAADLVEGATTR